MAMGYKGPFNYGLGTLGLSGSDPKLNQSINQSISQSICNDTAEPKNLSVQTIKLQQDIRMSLCVDIIM
jgi:hypothetical protein